jgi:hypothetical protein
MLKYNYQILGVVKMQKKILAILLILSMLLTFAACGGSAGNGGANDGGNQDVNVNDDAGLEETPKKDKTFELSDGTTTCVLAYDSSIYHEYKYIDESDKSKAEVTTDGGWTTLELKTGCTSAENYIEQYKGELTKGNNSYYMVKDIEITETESCEVEGRTYKLYQYSYVEEYVSQGSEFPANGAFAYVQVSDNVGVLMASCSPMSDGETSGFKALMESAVYISEVK